MTDDELDLVETEALVAALYRRQGPLGGVLVVEEDDRETKSIVRCWYRGGIVRAMGLNEYARLYLAAQMSPGNAQPISGD